MIAFSLGALVITIIALAMLLPALMNKKNINQIDRNAANLDIARDRLAELNALDKEGELSEAERELEATLLDELSSDEPDSRTTLSRGWGILILILIPVSSIGLYTILGNPELIGRDQEIVAPESEATPDIRQLVAQLEQRIAENPDNPDGWRIASNTYMLMGDFDKALVAYSRLYELVGETPDILTGWADAAIMANGNVYIPEARERIERALELDPGHINALWIAGLGAVSVGETPQALEYFRRLLPLISQDTEATAQVQQIISDISGSAAEDITQETQESGVAPAVIGFDVSVSLNPNLPSEVSGTDTVFVVAKAVEGPKIPLAVSRHSVKELPLKVYMDDSLAMLTDMKISNFSSVKVSARISKSGNAIAQPGDLISDEVVVDVANPSPVELTIYRQHQ